MSDNIFVRQKKKTVISTRSCRRSIEIGDYAIDQGFLLKFPGSSLAIFLYLITHADDQQRIETNTAIISSYLPESYDLDMIDSGLNFLEEQDIIDVSNKRNGNYTYLIKINIDKLTTEDPPAADEHRQNLDLSTDHHKSNDPGSSNDMNKDYLSLDCTYYDQRDIRFEILDKSSPDRSDLFKAILTFIPPNENINVLENRINQWLEDFDCAMIKELIRRVNKWLDKYNNPPEKGFHYLQGIIDDWYIKEISDYQDLKYFDQLYRETRELAHLYGLKEWQNIKPVHVETFNSWLQDGFPLSKDVIKLAIQEAFRRKKDGQPSLQYIENNFINPWKKKQVRNCKHAKSEMNRKYLENKNNSIQIKSDDNMGLESDWDSISWDFED
ncbi:MAG: DnaD domain protein [Bacillota bacterium]